MIKKVVFTSMSGARVLKEASLPFLRGPDLTSGNLEFIKALETYTTSSQTRTPADPVRGWSKALRHAICVEQVDLIILEQGYKVRHGLSVTSKARISMK